MLSTAKQPLTEDMIKTYHRILKSSTTDAQLEWVAAGDYKRDENIVGDLETTPPAEVPAAMQELLRQ